MKYGKKVIKEYTRFIFDFDNKKKIKEDMN